MIFSTNSLLNYSVYSDVPPSPSTMPTELYNDGKWKLVKDTATLPDGRTKTAVRGFHPDTAHILAFKGNKVLLLREYRAFDGRWIWMVPSGKMDKEIDHRTAADRELREETGYRAAFLYHIATMENSETYASKGHHYIAARLTHDPLPQDADEMIEVHECTLQEAIGRVLSCGEHSRVASAFLLLLAKERGWTSEDVLPME